MEAAGTSPSPRDDGAGRGATAAETPGISGGVHQRQSSGVAAARKKPLSPLLRRGEREYTANLAHTQFTDRASLIPDILSHGCI